MDYLGQELTELVPEHMSGFKYGYCLAWNAHECPVIVDRYGPTVPCDGTWATGRLGVPGKYRHCAKLPTLGARLSRLGRETGGKPTLQQMHDAISGRWFIKKDLLYRIDQVRHIDYERGSDFYPLDMSAIGFCFSMDTQRLAIRLNENGAQCANPHCLFQGLHDVPRNSGIMSRSDTEVNEDFARDYMSHHFQVSMERLIATRLPVFKWSE